MNRRNDFIIRNSEDLLERRELNIHKMQRTETKAYNQKIVENTIREGKEYKTAKKRLAIVCVLDILSSKSQLDYIPKERNVLQLCELLFTSVCFVFPSMLVPSITIKC
ncbi:hypothetical protein GQR58_011010 [Nymphon striatum]|nr:hypothetical protein GQR58_011010 [Nymphon striatum]